MATPDVTSDLIAEFRSSFIDNPHYRMAQNAVTRNKVEDVALSHQRATQLDHAVSHRLDDWEVTNQKRSGRCWMFAGLNLFRVGAMKAMNLKEFEFSQNYTFFWDKVERSNYLLEAIIETAHLPLDDRVVAWLLGHALDDGGQWNMFVNIVNKYGVVPKDVMPETESSGNTRTMNMHLLSQLRDGARRIRDIHQQGGISRGGISRGASAGGLGRGHAKVQAGDALGRVPHPVDSPGYTTGAVRVAVAG
jgi:bleomycin hydrolase